MAIGYDQRSCDLAYFLSFSLQLSFTNLLVYVKQNMMIFSILKSIFADLQAYLFSWSFMILIISV